MKETENQPPKSKRELLNERLAGKYPDKDFSDDEAFFGQISDDYDDYDNRISGFEEREGALSDLMTRDPRSAAFLTDWRSGEDPVVALVRRFGPEIKDALEDEKQQEALAKASAEYYKQLTKAKELNEAYEKNWPETLQRFSTLIEQGVIKEDEVDDLFGIIRKIVDEGIVGIISEDTILLAQKALKHDTDVADAERAGEVRGRNTKIEEKLRTGGTGDGTAHLDGKNGGARGGQGYRRDLGPLGDIDGTSTIWERGGEKRTRRE